MQLGPSKVERKIVAGHIRKDGTVFACQWIGGAGAPFRLEISKAALSQLGRHVFGQSRLKELGGVLLGHYYMDTNGDLLLLVTDALPAHEAKGSFTQLRFTVDSWARMVRLAGDQFPETHIAGWYHTHPGFGLFLSDDDCFLHRHFFLPDQVALVIDSWSGGAQVFIEDSSGKCGWTQSQPFNLETTTVEHVAGSPRLEDGHRHCEEVARDRRIWDNGAGSVWLSRIKEWWSSKVIGAANEVQVR